MDKDEQSRHIQAGYEAALAKRYNKYISLSYQYSKQLAEAEDTIGELKDRIDELEDQNKELRELSKPIWPV